MHLRRREGQISRCRDVEVDTYGRRRRGGVAGSEVDVEEYKSRRVEEAARWQG